MKLRFGAVFLASTLALAGCDRAENSAADSAGAPKLESPGPEAEPARSYQASSESARAVTGRLTVTMTTRMSDSEKDGSGPVDFLSLNAETGLRAEAMLDGGIAPSATVEGQTVRALMNLDVSASTLRVYRITSQTTPRGGRGLCGEGEATRIVVWESQGPGEQRLKLLSLSGDAPPGAGARICSAFDYARAAT